MIDKSSMANLYSKINWYYVIYVLLAFFLMVMAYYLYSSSSTKSSNEYVANRVHENGDMKSAEIILFYVDWCPHCKTAKPEWESVKEMYEGKKINDYTIIFTEHNCTNESSETESLLNKYKVEGYPTIKLLKDNQVIEFDAKPTKQYLEEFLNTAI